MDKAECIRNSRELFIEEWPITDSVWPEELFMAFFPYLSIYLYILISSLYRGYGYDPNLLALISESRRIPVRQDSQSNFRPEFVAPQEGNHCN